MIKPILILTFSHFVRWRLGFGGQGTHLVAQDAGYLAIAEAFGSEFPSHLTGSIHTP